LEAFEMPHLHWLYRMFHERNAGTFMISDDQPFRYEWLLGQIALCDRKLSEAGIKSGTVVAIKGDYTPHVIAALLALVDRGAICVPLSPSVDLQESEFCDIAEVQVSVTPDSTGVGRVERYDRVPCNELTRRLIEQQHPGLVLFTSGSTGKCKAALHDFTKLLKKFETPRRAMVTLAFLMIDHIGGINTLFSVLSSGGTVIASAERDPNVICGLIERHRVELLPTSPTFLNLLLMSESYRQYDLTSLKLMTYGTELMPQSTLERIRSIFPDARLQQTYGLSELGILRSKSESSDSLWVQIGGEGFETKVEDGTLRIRAQSAMLGYLNAASPFGSDGWFDTQDLIQTNGEFVRFLGRRSDIINVGGNKVYPAEVENFLLQMNNVEDATVVGAPNPITGRMVVAQIKLKEPEEPAEFRKRVRDFCQGRLERFKIPAKIEIVDRSQFNSRFKKIRQVAVAGESH
jgi:long-chain acyl-CoA synthetase